MRLPIIHGVIDRRVLVNYRVDPRMLAEILPAPFRPQVIHGQGLAGICLIRLSHVRPRGLPPWLGLSSENAAHRVAVEWDDGIRRRSGVYILRRDTNSRLNTLAGGRVFPGVHQHASFACHETDNRYDIAMRSDDGKTTIQVRAEQAQVWPADSLFATLPEASQFFAAGSLGYSPTTTAGRFAGLELRCRSWQMEPLIVQEVRSSLFDDQEIFPHGTIHLDNALLMRGIEHEWHSRGDLSSTLQSSPLGMNSSSHSDASAASTPASSWLTASA
jgi:hypothetical protein